jgi:thioredoxin
VSTHVKNLTADAFEAEVTQATSPVVVDFYATWCGPCKIQAPILDRMAGEYDGRVKFLQVDVDKEPKLAEQFGIRSIPTLLVFNGGEIVEKYVGLTPEETLKTRLSALNTATPAAN